MKKSPAFFNNCIEAEVKPKIIVQFVAFLGKDIFEYAFNTILEDRKKQDAQIERNKIQNEADKLLRIEHEKEKLEKKEEQKRQILKLEAEEQQRFFEQQERLSNVEEIKLQELPDLEESNGKSEPEIEIPLDNEPEK
jgi:hypothetical protein